MLISQFWCYYLNLSEVFIEKFILFQNAFQFLINYLSLSLPFLRSRCKTKFSSIIKVNIFVRILRRRKFFSNVTQKFMFADFLFFIINIPNENLQLKHFSSRTKSFKLFQQICVCSALIHTPVHDGAHVSSRTLETFCALKHVGKANRQQSSCNAISFCFVFTTRSVLEHKFKEVPDFFNIKNV